MFCGIHRTWRQHASRSGFVHEGIHLGSPATSSGAPILAPGMRGPRWPTWRGSADSA